MVSDRLVLDSVVRVAGRTAASVHCNLKRGVDHLATVAAVAPLLALLDHGGGNRQFVCRLRRREVDLHARAT
jgi:hypothetical protein